MESELAFNEYCETKYKKTETAKSGVLTSERKRIIVDFLKNPETRADPKLKHFIKKRQFQLINNELCKQKEINGVITYLEVPAVEELHGVIKRIHEEYGHDGITKTFKAVQQRYAYVPRDVVDKYISLCLTCQLKRTQKRIPTVKPIVSERPLHRCLIDLIKPEQPDGPFKYIMTYIDHFSKFVILKPLKTKEGIEVATTVRESVFCVLGKPSILHTDNGGEFCNKHMEDLLQTWPGECVFVHGRPRHPESQGVVERANRTMKEKLATSALQKGQPTHTAWSTWLPEIAYQMNTSYHSTVKMTPYECMFSRSPFRDALDRDATASLCSQQSPPSVIRARSPPSAVRARSPPSAVRARSPPSAVRARRPPSAVRARRLPSAIRARRPPSAVRARRQPSAVRARRQPSAVRAHRQPSAVRAPRQPSAVRAPRQPSAVRAPRQPSAVRARRQPSAVRARRQPSAVRARRQPSAVRARRQPSAVRARRLPSEPVVCNQPSEPVVCTQPSEPVVCTQPPEPVVCTQPSEPVVCTQPSKPVSCTLPSEPVSCTLPSEPDSCTLPSEPVARTLLSQQEPTWPVLVTPILQRLKNEDFDESSCDLALDTLDKIHWDATVEAAKIITGLLPSLPVEDPSTIRGSHLGAFGDGFVKFIPTTLKEDYKVAVKTSPEGNSCFYRSMSILLFGNEDHHLYLRLASTCYGIARMQEISQHIHKSHSSQEDVVAFLSAATTDETMRLLEHLVSPEQSVQLGVQRELNLSLNSQRDAGPIQCLSMSFFISRPITVWTVHSDDETCTIYNMTTNNKAPFHLVLVPTDLASMRLSHFVPVIDGNLVGKGQSERETCGAVIHGLCQGDCGDMAECELCHQWYHLQCLGRMSVRQLEMQFHCGCHKTHPLRPKSPAYYQNVREVMKTAKKINLEKLTSDIIAGKYTSARWAAFTRGATKDQKPWKFRLAYHRYGESVMDFLCRKLAKLEIAALNKVTILDVFYPEIAIHIAMQQEGLTRVEADIFLNQSVWWFEFHSIPV